MSKWWPNDNFWVNCPFKNQPLKNYLLIWIYLGVWASYTADTLRVWFHFLKVKHEPFQMRWNNCPKKMLQCSTNKHCTCKRFMNKQEYLRESSKSYRTDVYVTHVRVVNWCLSITILIDRSSDRLQNTVGQPCMDVLYCQFYLFIFSYSYSQKLCKIEFIVINVPCNFIKCLLDF